MTMLPPPENAWIDSEAGENPFVAERGYSDDAVMTVFARVFPTHLLLPNIHEMALGRFLQNVQAAAQDSSVKRFCIKQFINGTFKPLTPNVGFVTLRTEDAAVTLRLRATNSKASGPVKVIDAQTLDAFGVKNKVISIGRYFAASLHVTEGTNQTRIFHPNEGDMLVAGQVGSPERRNHDDWLAEVEANVKRQRKLTA